MKKQKYIYYLKDSKGKTIEHFRHKLTALHFLSKFKRENPSERDSCIELQLKWLWKKVDVFFVSPARGNNTVGFIGQTKRENKTNGVNSVGELSNQ